MVSFMLILMEGLLHILMRGRVQMDLLLQLMILLRGSQLEIIL